MKIVVACGGTGGHAFPGLAVAEELRRRGHEVTVWDSGRDVESSVMRSWNGPIFSTGAKQLSLRNLFAIWRSIRRCRWEMKKAKPDALLAMGSYSSLPPVLAAKKCGVPVVLHEANTVPGRAVEFLSRYAKTVAISFDVTAKYLPGVKTVRSGLPVRDGITKVNEELRRRGEAAKRKLYVIHQTGVKDEGPVMAAYAAAGMDARVHAFEQEMANAFATADIVVARAGASTCFELAACAKPALLIPLPTAMRDHQHYNADAFAASGAADEGIQSKLAAHQLSRYLLAKYDHPEQLVAMREKMALLATPDAAAKVAELVESSAK